MSARKYSAANSSLACVIHLLSTFLPMAVLICGAAYYIFTGMKERNAVQIRSREAAAIEFGRTVVGHRLEEIKRDLAILSENHSLQEYLDREEFGDFLVFEHDTLNLSASSPGYDRIRWLDETGMERMSIVRSGGTPAATPIEKLKNRRSQPDVEAAFRLGRGETYLSPPAFGSARDRIAPSYRPVLRIAAPVIDRRGSKRGIVLLDYSGSDLLARFDHSVADIADHIRLLDPDGFELNNSGQNGKRALRTGSEQRFFARQFPDAWQRIRGQDHGQFEDAEGLWTFNTIYRAKTGRYPADPAANADCPSCWKAVAHVPPDTLFGNYLLYEPFFMEIVFLLLLQFALSWKLATRRRFWNTTQEKALYTQKHLELLVNKRTTQLKADIELRKQAENALRSEKFILSESQRIAHIGSWKVDPATANLECSEETCRILGASHQTEIQTLDSFYSLVHPDDHKSIRTWAEACLSDRPPGEIEFRTVAPNGQIRILSCCGGLHHDAAHRSAVMIGTIQDITANKQADAQLKLAAKVFDQSSEGFMITDAGLNIIRVNHAFTVITGYSEEEILGMNVCLLSSDRNNRDYYKNILDSLGTEDHWQGEIWNRRKNGEIYPELLNISVVRDRSGQITEYIGVFSDITPLKASQARLEFFAYHDPLTELPNRLQLFSSLQHGIDMARRENRKLALLMLDLDRFKDVNDSFGHTIGDQLLQLVAERLTRRLRNADTVARLGGDEFTVLLENIDHPENVARVAESIISDLREPLKFNQLGEFMIGVSIGISLFPQHGDTPEVLLQQADAALYQAKKTGGNQYAYFSDDLTRAARERIELESRLRQAIAKNELRVFYQPQVDIATDRIVGAESLLRWFDPKEGLIAPVRFIPIAEQTGLIMPIGEWVLQETCRQGRRWLDEGLPSLTLAVNVSPYQFRHREISGVVREVLNETRFPSDRLELELTESGLMEHQDHAVNLLNNLRSQGIRLAIDDFGTGYSSLAYLKCFPLDVLKIDKTFIDDIPHHQDDREIAATIVGIGHTLGFKVLAEGVEKPEQLSFLQMQGCDLYQGYLKSRPLPVEEFTELLRDQQRNCLMKNV
ncbi:MAG: bifunctional diguanylate cyclase/phosphodiesterase [Gammaproteobacteria bacterium]